MAKLGTTQDAAPLEYYPSDHKTLGDWKQFANGDEPISHVFKIQ